MRTFPKTIEGHSKLSSKVSFAAVIGCLFVLAIACGSDGPADSVVIAAQPPETYYFEARIEAFPNEQASNQSPFPADEPSISELHVWVAPGGKFRQESTTSSPAHLSRRTVLVSNGTVAFSYDSSSNRYQRSEPLPEGVTPLSYSSVLLGLIPGGEFNSWVSRLKENHPPFDARLIGEEVILGRRVDLYELLNVGSLVDESGNVTATGMSRIWVDRQTDMVLKYESGPIGRSGQSVVALMTKLDIDPEVDDAVFVFNPPSGAVEVDAPSGPVTVTVGGPNSSSELLEVGFVIGDLMQTSSSTSTSTQLVTSKEGVWEGHSGRKLQVRQFFRADGLPATLVSEEVVIDPEAPHGSPYYVTRSPEEGLISLAWQYGDVTVQMDGIRITLDELVRIANSIGPSD